MTAKRPNILLIFTDMQRADTIHALGNPAIQTPNLDRLVREGTAFTQCYSPSPVCIPARYAMHYGVHPLRTGCVENGAMPADNGTSFMDQLTAGGYRTHGIGKCHFTGGDRWARRGFETRETQEEGGGDDDYRRYLKESGFDWIDEPHGIRSEMYYVPQLSALPAAHHPTAWIADRSISFMREQQAAEADRPWFLFCSFIHPHPPLAPPSPWHKLYRSQLLPDPVVPPQSAALHTYVNRHQNRYKYRDQGIDAHLVRGMKAYYYACISFIDYQIGRLLETLETTGQLDNTMVLFTSDHGELLGDYNCFGKRSMHDPSVRVPLLVRYPGRFPADARITCPASLLDIAPTILQEGGVEADNLVLDGCPLQALASGSRERQAVVSVHAAGAYAQYLIATARWKYIYSAPDRLTLLFDRENDPHDCRNLAGMSLLRGIEEELGAALRQEVLKYGRDDAVTTGPGGKTSWRLYDQPAAPRNPNAGLLFQDGPLASPLPAGYHFPPPAAGLGTGG